MCLFVCGLAASTFCQSSFSQYNMSTMLGSQVKLSYKIENNTAYFLVEKSAAGYVSFGLGTSMANADVVLIEKSTDGTMLTIKDCRLQGEIAPICDEVSQDWKWTSSNSYTATATTLKAEIMRSLAVTSATAERDMAIMTGENNIIYAYTTSNAGNGHDSTGGMGVKKINFNPGSGSSSATISGIGNFIVAMFFVLSISY